MPAESPNVPDGLVDAVAAGRVVLFAGAGVSRGEVETEEGPAEQAIPGWGELLVRLADRAVEIGHVPPGEGGRLRRAVRDGKYLFVAETIRRKLGAREFDEAMDDLFRHASLRPTRRHHLITSIPFAAVITTNYDKLLESAYAQGGRIPPTYTFDNAPDIISSLSHERFFIMKAHGDIDRKDTVVLSERDYRDVIHRQPGYRAALSTIFITKTVLFVGTSLHDTDVNLVLESVSETFGGKGPRHYALIPKTDAGESEVQHWRDFFGIHLLQYRATRGHPQVDRFLEALRDRVARKLGRTEGAPDARRSA